jgi:NADPH:quinone reductase-like Zn-dependent oxidoreductase
MVATPKSSVAPPPTPGRRTMTAGRIHRFGPPDAIELEQIEVPRPGDGEILVRVKAAGVGPWDAWIRAGRSVLPQPLPLTLGSDICGVVDELGPDVREFALGEAVFGVTNARFTGGYAEYAVATAGMMARKPATLLDVEAASVPVVAVTAWQMLVDHAGAAAGQTVFIHGAAGNVGAYAVQLARWRGLRVLASARAGSAPAVHALGADDVIEVPSARLGELARCADAVIDTVGGDTQTLLFELLKPGGTLVSAVSKPDERRASRYRVRAIFFIVEIASPYLIQLAKLIDAGALKPSVGRVLPLSEARMAHEMVEGLRPRPAGKIVFLVAP